MTKKKTGWGAIKLSSVD